MIFYPDGFSKPIFRGVIHIVSSVILPSLTYMLYNYSGILENRKSYLLATFASTIIQLIFSSIVHISDYTDISFKTFKLILRIDHALIFVSLYSSISWIKCWDDTLNNCFIPLKIMTMLGILHELLFKESTKRYQLLILMAGITLLFPIYYVNTIYKDIIYLLLFNSSLMFFTYSLQFPLRHNKIFTYHEIMHLIMMINMSIMYFSIIYLV